MMCFWTFTKLILKWFFVNIISNKVVQHSKNKIVLNFFDIRWFKNTWLKKL
jgi:hypothetical protein